MYLFQRKCFCFVFSCVPLFLPHSKQNVLKQMAFFSHLRELVAHFCFGNQNGRGNLCGFGVCAAGACCPAAPLSAQGPLLSGCVASGPGDFSARLSPVVEQSPRTASPRPRASRAFLCPPLPQTHLHQNPQDCLSPSSIPRVSPPSVPVSEVLA